MNRFADSLSSKSNTTRTENGAETYRSTLNSVLDFFYLAPARQDQDNTALFVAAFDQDPLLAMKCLFYIRDVRGGKGQRRTFADILNYLYTEEPGIFRKIVPFVPEYGYWKDIIRFVDSREVRRLVINQLQDDATFEHPSLLAKWMPSENASSKWTIALATKWRKVLHLSSSDYRKLLSSIRERIGIPERKMSLSEWEKINYSAVPSRAMKLYRKAFERHDERRFKAFIEDALTGKAKINSANVYPHEIVKHFLGYSLSNDKALEAMWKQLPNYFDGSERKILPLIDVSSSMMDNNVLHIAIALGMYCAERNDGPFKDMFITFASDPSFVVIKGNSLLSRVDSIKKAHWGGSTNLHKAFQEILKMAISNSVPQEDMPTNFLVLSDMEFDSPYIGGKNLDAIRGMYTSHGYDVPVLTFWNLSARRNQAPATATERDVFLVSGFSAETIGTVLNMENVIEKTPEELMMNVLGRDRYAFLDNLVQ